MIPRYSRPEMAELWSAETRLATWVRIEVLAAEAMAGLGIVPAAALEDIRRAPVPTEQEVSAWEQVRDHEVLSFLAAYCERLPTASARWVHLGMTSYDVVDTALGHILARATDLLTGAAGELEQALTDLAVAHWDTVCIGRTHGMHAEPTTFGHKLAGFAFAIRRSVERLAAARAAVAVGTISGAVGTYALVDPAVERHVCAALGLGIEPAPSQIVARDRHAQLIQAVALLGACVEQLGLELRLLQRTEVAEVEEARSVAYQGSSAMPHKRNPTKAERLCGLARVLRGYATTALEDVAVWHERDLAHQSVERIVLPDALTLAHYQVTLATEVVRTLTVRPERMRAAVGHTRGLAASSAVLAELLRSGMEREQAYRAVQRASDLAAETGGTLRDAFDATVDPEAWEPEWYLRNHHAVLDRLKELDATSDAAR
ncbi:adenylosuccinate lyase [Dactylosporangium aurantiacum]|uniref:Adenylosuccinate lyase n=1 Tax=Dactylosporangium aurantiacum TaxID=35754 RepID=A0A9Q9MFM6_9ACTN|nr:adenylosuccinate lyase [Dactylosporangium aurantiacum]MDG6106609.1 adenylosuccinate lyase [Dactylosporangium aurantiacum]UWZ50771.1 adenylosuccinate lyase [Dactylosporangium aurantiacum]